jgi:DNA-binding protein HU-beta
LYFDSSIFVPLIICITKKKLKIMNKSELIDSVAASAGLSKVDAKKAVDAFTSSVEGALAKGERVALVGFGSWSVSNRPARTGRNPQTGKEIKIAAKNVVRFKAGSDLSKTV